VTRGIGMNVVPRYSIEEFDPGSACTLAAWLRHASRTGVAIHQWRTGE
jgi:hypothetical protein